MFRFARLSILLLLGFSGCQHTAPQRSPSFHTADFTFPWSAKPVLRTAFTAWSDASRLHFRFRVKDDDIITRAEWRGESTLDGEDRVELFFARKDDAALRDYWCLEIDPLGRVHDYHARHYRKFDHSWNCRGLRTTARRLPDGYEVTAAVPLATLSALLGEPVTRGSTLRLGLFRAEFFGRDKATHGEASDNWLSWARPVSRTPDFHIPSAFRRWELP